VSDARQGGQGLGALFQAVLLDPAVRAAFDADPLAVLDAFDLSPADRRALAEQGPEALALLGQVTTGPAAALPVDATEGRGAYALQTASVGLAVVPLSVDAAGHVRWSATLLPGDATPTPAGALRLQVDLHATLREGQVSVAPQVRQVTSEPPPPPPRGTWALRTVGDDVAAAAARVHAAAPDQRVNAVLALLDAMGAP